MHSTLLCCLTAVIICSVSYATSIAPSAAHASYFAQLPPAHPSLTGHRDVMVLPTVAGGIVHNSNDPHFSIAGPARDVSLNSTLARNMFRVVPRLNYRKNAMRLNAPRGKKHAHGAKAHPHHSKGRQVQAHAIFHHTSAHSQVAHPAANMTRGQHLHGGPISHAYAKVLMRKNHGAIKCHHFKQNGALVSKCDGVVPGTVYERLEDAEIFTRALVQNMTRQHADKDLLQTVIHTREW
eukprot:CAMPEP_0185845188 /NCGR_PEP_ID=MMETSP1354-20130828/1215_1 /TAXON_ID=708628 /ORGANISM="Erythrolobus madagascarensis, Strain CCMP3276" /LENGTH=236 /DNA_ID=CAMNT_0028545083 /DNA_START=223 /DNA_END=930 /DNA_ORIENTATION=-